MAFAPGLGAETASRQQGSLPVLLDQRLEPRLVCDNGYGQMLLAKPLLPRQQGG